MSVIANGEAVPTEFPSTIEQFLVRRGCSLEVWSWSTMETPWLLLSSPSAPSAPEIISKSYESWLEVEVSLQVGPPTFSA